MAGKNDSDELAGVKLDHATITVGGVTFGADQVKSVCVVIDGREVQIGEKASDDRIGFRANRKSE